MWKDILKLSSLMLVGSSAGMHIGAYTKYSTGWLICAILMLGALLISAWVYEIGCVKEKHHD